MLIDRDRDADEERHARAVEDAAVDVAAEAVGAHPVRERARWLPSSLRIVCSTPGTRLRKAGLISDGSDGAEHRRRKADERP